MPLLDYRGRPSQPSPLGMYGVPSLTPDAIAPDAFDENQLLRDRLHAKMGAVPLGPNGVEPPQLSRPARLITDPPAAGIPNNQDVTPTTPRQRMGYDDILSELAPPAAPAADHTMFIQNGPYASAVDYTGGRASRVFDPGDATRSYPVDPKFDNTAALQKNLFAQQAPDIAGPEALLRQLYPEKGGIGNYSGDDYRHAYDTYNRNKNIASTLSIDKTKADAEMVKANALMQQAGNNRNNADVGERALLARALGEEYTRLTDPTIAKAQGRLPITHAQWETDYKPAFMAKFSKQQADADAMYRKTFRNEAGIGAPGAAPAAAPAGPEAIPGFDEVLNAANIAQNAGQLSELLTTPQYSTLAGNQSALAELGKRLLARDPNVREKVLQTMGSLGSVTPLPPGYSQKETGIIDALGLGAKYPPADNYSTPGLKWTTSILNAPGGKSIRVQDPYSIFSLPTPMRSADAQRKERDRMMVLSKLYDAMQQKGQNP